MTSTQNNGATRTAPESGHHPSTPMPWAGMPRRTPVRDLMTRRVVAVDPRTDYATVVAAMREHHHSLLPVVDAERRVMGLVSASDLLAKLALQALPAPGLRFETHQIRAVRRRATGVVARELMTTPAWTVTADSSAADAAWVAVRQRIHHLPVTDDRHRLVGMVCLCDLLRAVGRDDADIRAEILEIALAAEVCAEYASLRVHCDHGRVLLDARTVRRSQADKLLDLVRAVEGVVDVAETLRWDIDDLLLPHQPHHL